MPRSRSRVADLAGSDLWTSARDSRAIAIDGFSLSPLTRTLRGIRPKVLVFVGLLIGVLAVVKPFMAAILFRCGADNCGLAGTKP